MKNKILSEQFIVECRRAKSYIIFECALAVILILATFFISRAIQYISYIGIIAVVIEVIWFLIYLIVVRKNTVGISRNFVTGHTGLINTYDIIMPVNKIDNISITSNFFENISGATTIIIGVPGKFRGVKFRGMDKESAIQVIMIFQKIIITDSQTHTQTKPRTNAG